MKIILTILFLGLFSVAAYGGTKEYCADKWPGDKEKQELCRKDQAKAHMEINKMAEAHGLLNAKGQIYVEPTGGEIEKFFYDSMKSGLRQEFKTYDYRIVALKLNKFIDTPDDILKEIKIRNKDEKSIYLQIYCYKYLKRHKPSNIPENFIRDMKRDVRQRHPKDYIQQWSLFRKKVLAYYSNHNLTPSEDYHSQPHDDSISNKIDDSLNKADELSMKEAYTKDQLAKAQDTGSQSEYRSEAVMYTFTGPGGRVTEHFDVDKYWLVKWRNQGGSSQNWYRKSRVRHYVSRYFGVKVYDEDGKFIELAANTTDHEVGVTMIKTGGRFYLDIESKGNWDVRIIEMELQNDTPLKTYHEYLMEPWEVVSPSPHHN